MARSASLSAIALVALLPATAAAQDTDKGTIAKPRTQLLLRACERMAKLAGVKFRTIEAQDSSMTRAITRRMAGLGGGGFGGGDIEVEGTWCNGVLNASIDGDADQVVRHAGRTIAREGNQADWKRRRDTLAGGDTMPFLFDPQLFFEIMHGLSENELGVRHVEETKYRDHDVVILGLTFEQRTAGDLQHCGMLPRPSTGSRGIRIGGQLPGGNSTRGATIDMALYIDPETALVHRVRVKSYKEGDGMGGMVIQVAGGGGGGEEVEEEKVEEFDADGKRIYKRGLPVRALDDGLSVVTYDVRLTDHGKTFKVDLDPGIRRYLKMAKGR